MSNLYRCKISVLIVTYNNAATISNCLESLNKQSFEDFEIIVLDNSSNDATIEQLDKYDNIKLFQSEENIGFGAGVNYLSRMANGEYLLILNPDCMVTDNTLARLHDFAVKHIGAISPALIYPDGAQQPSARQLLSYKNVIFSRRSLIYQLGFTKTRQAGYIIPDRPAKVPAISATAMFIKAELFNRVNGFDERFFLYLEDIDLCVRLSLINIDIWYLPDVKIKHLLGASSSETSIKSSYYHHFSMYKYFTKHFRRNYIKNLLLLLLLTAGFISSILLDLLKPKRRK